NGLADKRRELGGVHRAQGMQAEMKAGLLDLLARDLDAGVGEQIKFVALVPQADIRALHIVGSAPLDQLVERQSGTEIDAYPVVKSAHASSSLRRSKIDCLAVANYHRSRRSDPVPGDVD